MEKASNPTQPYTSLAEQWRREVSLMRCGADPDWRRWSVASRARWASAMLAVAAECEAVPDERDKAWLESLAAMDTSKD